VPDFRTWHDRVDACGGILPDRVRVTRTATEENADEERGRQMAVMTACWGEVEPAWCWHEVAPGHHLQRPVLADLLAFCDANPRPSNAPGWVEWSAPDRVGRFLDETDRPDIFVLLLLLDRFKVSGWLPRFTTLSDVGATVAPVDAVIQAYGSPDTEEGIW
jgi:hypothetical protein